MKKYILILLLIGQLSNAQYNLFARQNFAKSASAPTFNTEIGGVASTISTPALLAAKLAIDVSRITNFSIVGSDIKCKITGSYAVIGFDFNETPCTYYKDTDYLVTALGHWAFYSTYNFQGYDVDFQNCLTVDSSALSRVYANRFLLKNVTSIANNGFWQSPIAKVFYIPNCTSLGSTVGDNAVFVDINPAAYIYCHPSLATNNGGAPDGDLAYAIARGCSVRYVTNFTAPNQITDLSAGTIYNTAIQLNFTAPSSTNAIDYYDLYINGILQTQQITASGQFITGLTPSTSYNITLIAVDIFYNKSVVSNSVTQSTASASWDISTGLVSYYKLDSNSNDSFGSNNGTDTSVSYVSGKVSNAASFNGTSSKTIVGNPANLQLTNVSISTWIKSSGAGSGDRGMIFKRYAYNLFFYSNKLATYSYGTPAGYKDTGVNVCDGTWKHIVLTQQSGVTNGTKLYINGVLVLTTTVGQTGQADNLEFAAIAGGGFANYSQDETAIYNIALTQTQIDLLYNSGIGITL